MNRVTRFPYYDSGKGIASSTERRRSGVARRTAIAVLVIVSATVAGHPALAAETAGNAETAESAENAGAAGETIRLSLDEAIERARTEGLEGRLLRGGRRDDALQYDAALANLRWGVNLTGDYERRDSFTDSGSPTDRVSGSVRASGPRASLTGSLSHEIDGGSNISLSTSYIIYDGYRGGEAAASRERAALSDERRRLSRDSDFRDLEFDVIEAYTAVRSAEQTLGVRRIGLELREEDDLAAAESNLEAASRRMALLTGFPTGTRFALDDAGRESAGLSPRWSREDAVAVALERRADLRAFEIDERTLEIDGALTRAGRRPEVDVSAGVSGNPGWDDSDRDVSWNAGVRLSVPIFDPTYRIAVERGRVAMENLAQERRRLGESIRSDLRMRSLELNRR